METVRPLWKEEYGHPVCRVKEISSTNEQLKSWAKAGLAPDGCVLLAESQTAGRGRLGRSFFSPEGGGLYFSYLFFTGKENGRLTEITPRAAVVLRDSVEAVCGAHPEIKWVNDLLLEGRKISGILTETTEIPERPGQRAVIVGIGVNVNTHPERFPPELRDRAGSLYSVLGRTVDPESLLGAVLNRISRLSDDSDETSQADYDAYRFSCRTVGQKILVNDREKEFRAECVSLERDYSLRVRLEDGTLTSLRSGDVSVRKEE